MKHILGVFLILFATPFAEAACDLKIAISTANYIITLEKIGRRDQQVLPCQTLAAQYNACSSSEKIELGRRVDLVQVLGNICMPHTTPPVQ